MWFVAKVYANRLWIIGGFSNGKSVNYADAWHTQDATTWQELSPKPPWSPM